jgi:hypothetical protein
VGERLASETSVAQIISLIKEVRLKNLGYEAFFAAKTFHVAATRRSYYSAARRFSVAAKTLRELGGSGAAALHLSLLSLANPALLRANARNRCI